MIGGICLVEGGGFGNGWAVASSLDGHMNGSLPVFAGRTGLIVFGIGTRNAQMVMWMSFGLLYPLLLDEY